MKNINLTISLALLLENKCRTGVMETYWCCKNNSIVDNYLNQDFNPALVPALKKSARSGESGKVVDGVFFS